MTIPSSGASSSVTRRLPAYQREAAEARSRLAPVRALPELFDVRVKHARSPTCSRWAPRSGCSRWPSAPERGERPRAGAARDGRHRDRRSRLGEPRPPSRVAHTRGAALRHADQPRQLLRGPVHALPDALHLGRAVRVLLLPACEALAHMAIVAVVRSCWRCRTRTARWSAGCWRSARRWWPASISRLLRLLGDRAQQLERSDTHAHGARHRPGRVHHARPRRRDHHLERRGPAAFGWTAAEAIGKTMRYAARVRRAPRRAPQRADRERVGARDRALRGGVPAPRRQRFPGEATVSKVEIEGEVFVSGFITDVTERAAARPSARRCCASRRRGRGRARDRARGRHAGAG